MIVAVGIMAGGTLQQPRAVQLYLGGEGSRISQFPVAQGQGAIVEEGDWVVIGEVGTELRRTFWHEADTTDKGYLLWSGDDRP